MSYQVLARKWRPKTFQEMAGQVHVLQTLTHALEQQRLHHAYLFTGTRGVGKTTVARILARCLNCEDGITATPCGVCDSCREISEGRFIDLIEVDAASRTRVEDTRELLDNVQYAPSRGRFKVYLIDEVHMLSTHSFNALLKTLEEPPPHVKFLLATTDPQKLPITVLSRCLQFHLKNLAPAQIVNYLQSVLTAEQIDNEEDALWQLARAAGGSMRDALTLLDQSISFGGGRVHVAAVTALLGTPDHATVFAFVQALAERDGSALITTVAACAENNPDYARLLEQMVSVFHRIALAQILPDAIDNSEGDRQQIATLAAALAAEDVQLYYQICVQTLQDMPHSPDKRICFEMGLLRMLAFSPDVFQGEGVSLLEKKKPDAIAPQTAAAESPHALQSQTIPEPQPALQPAQEPQPAEKPQPAQEPRFSAELRPPVVEPQPQEEPQPPKEPQPKEESELAPQSRAEPEPRQTHQARIETTPAHTRSSEALPPANATQGEASTMSAAAPDIKPDPPSQPASPPDFTDWFQLVQHCQLNGISGNIVANCLPESTEENCYRLVLDEKQSALYSEDQQGKIAAALSATLGRPIEVKIRIGALTGESPAERRRREKEEAIEELHQRFYTDPGVRALVTAFDATVDADSFQIRSTSAQNARH